MGNLQSVHKAKTMITWSPGGGRWSQGSRGQRWLKNPKESPSLAPRTSHRHIAFGFPGRFQNMQTTHSKSLVRLALTANFLMGGGLWNRSKGMIF